MRAVFRCASGSAPGPRSLEPGEPMECVARPPGRAEWSLMPCIACAQCGSSARWQWSRGRSTSAAQHADVLDLSCWLKDSLWDARAATPTGLLVSASFYCTHSMTPSWLRFCKLYPFPWLAPWRLTLMAAVWAASIALLQTSGLRWEPDRAYQPSCIASSDLATSQWASPHTNRLCVAPHPLRTDCQMHCALLAWLKRRL